MEELNAKGHLIYELLRIKFANDLDQKVKDQGESLLCSMSNLLEANNSTLDGLMSAREDDIQEELMLDIDQIKADLYKTDAVDLHPMADIELFNIALLAKQSWRLL